MSNRILSATLIVSIAAGFLVCRRAEASREQELIPDLPSATMEMSWTDMRRLLTATEEPADEEEKPPIDWGLASAEYDAEVLATGSVRIDGRFQIFMWKTKGWVEVPIIGQDVAPASVTLDGEPASLARTEHGTFAVLLDEPGVHALELAFFVGSGSEDGVASFSFACAPTAVTRMNLRIPARDAEVQSAAAANVTVERGETHLTADLTFRPSERIEVSWTLPAEILAKAQERPPEPPRIACRASTLLTLADRYLSGQSMLHYELLRGSTDTFSCTCRRR